MNIVFDTIIIAFLFISGSLSFVIRKRLRQGGVRVFLSAASIIAFIVIFYGSYIEPQLIVVTEQVITVKSERPLDLTIALISDLHVGPYKREAFVTRAVERINSLKPDLVLIAGDSVFEEAKEAQYLAPLKNIRAPLGVYGVLGNHDYGITPEGELRHRRDQADIVRAQMEEYGVKMLVNDGLTLSKNGAPIALTGTDEWWTGRANIKRALTKAAASARTPTLLLTHNPDIIRAAQRFGIDLVLAGHTHGGQVRLPFIGPVPPIPDELGREFDQGLFSFGKTQLFITRGIGEMAARARLFAPPEIVQLRVTN